MVISGDAAIAVDWACLGVALFFVILRVWARHWRGLLNLSDALVVITWFIYLSHTVCNHELWRHGLYQPHLSWREDWSQAISNPDTRVYLMKLSYASYFPYALALWGVKFSLLALYYTLITNQLPKLRLALHVVGLYTVVSLIISIALNLFWCIPISKNWSLEIIDSDEGTCFSSIIPYVIPIVFHITTDFALYIFPFILLKSLRINLQRRQFVGVVGLLGFGGLCIAVAIGRFVASGAEVKIPTLAVWTSLELMTGLIVVCLPALKVFFMRQTCPILIQIRQKHASVGSGGDLDTIKSRLSVRSRTASKTSENMFVNEPTTELEMSDKQPQKPAQAARSASVKRSRGHSLSRCLPRISQSREGLVNPDDFTQPPVPVASTSSNAARKLSQDRPAFPPSEFKVEESLRQNNGNVQESVMALRDDILKSLSYAYDEDSYDHSQHTHTHRSDRTQVSGWR